MVFIHIRPLHPTLRAYPGLRTLTIKKMTRTSKADRLAHVQAWRSSELSRADYCRQHGIKYSTFLTWFKLEADISVPGKFVALPQNQETPGLITITFSNGIQVEYSGEVNSSKSCCLALSASALSVRPTLIKGCCSKINPRPVNP